MAIILWKNGMFKICNEFSYEHELEDGWSLTKEPKVEVKEPEVVVPEVEEPEVEEKTEESEEKELEKKSELIEKLKAKKLELVKDLEKLDKE